MLKENEEAVIEYFDEYIFRDLSLPDIRDNLIKKYGRLSEESIKKIMDAEMFKRGIFGRMPLQVRKDFTIGDWHKMTKEQKEEFYGRA